MKPEDLFSLVTAVVMFIGLLSGYVLGFGRGYQSSDKRFEVFRRKLPKDLEYRAVCQFVDRVNAQAEKKMEMTGKLEGSHYAAMQQELAKMTQEAFE